MLERVDDFTKLGMVREDFIVLSHRVGYLAFIIFVVITESQETIFSSLCDTHKDCSSLESEIWAECTLMEEILDEGLQYTRK
jgi:hypothetical protein